jgi:hypothetical protein
MKTTIKILPFLLLTGMILAAGQPAMGAIGKEIPDAESLVTVDPHAPGTRVKGTVAIYYDDVYDYEDVLQPACGRRATTMYVFMRLSQGKANYSYSGRVSDICYFHDDELAQQNAIKQLIEDDVVPVIFPNAIDPPIALRSAENFAQDNQLFFPGSPFFLMMDVEIAIDD